MSGTGGTHAMANRLRAATRERHARLEAITGLPDSLCTRTDLVTTLADLYGFHAAIEEIAPSEVYWASVELPHCAASRRDWLAADLARLGVAPASIAALPRCPGLGPLDTDGARFGAAWVIEGSAMGGRIIQAHLERYPERFGSGARPLRLRFLAGHGARSGAHWRRFGRALEARPPGEAAAIVGSACRTFDALGDWFARSGRSSPAAPPAGGPFAGQRRAEHPRTEHPGTKHP